MPIIEEIRVREGQLVALVETGRSEIVRIGDIFPHFAGKRYRAMCTMTLLPDDDPRGAWRRKKLEKLVEDVRTVEVVVVEYSHSRSEVRKQRGGLG